MRGYRVESVRRVFDGFFGVDQARVAYEKADGSWSEPSDRLSVERGDAAAVLIHDIERDRFLLVRQFRYPTVRHGEPWLLEIVAGKVDEGETPEQAAIRETEEEVGLKIESVERIAEFYGSPGGMSEKITVYFAEARKEHRSGGGGGLEGEDVEIVELDPHEAITMMDRGEIRDGKTQIALAWYARRKL